MKGPANFVLLLFAPSPPRAGLVLFHHYMYCRDRITSPPTLLLFPPMPNVLKAMQKIAPLHWSGTGCWKRPVCFHLLFSREKKKHVKIHSRFPDTC